MSAIKIALKASKAALDRKDYNEAVEKANKVLETDPNNYHAYVLISPSDILGPLGLLKPLGKERIHRLSP